MTIVKSLNPTLGNIHGTDLAVPVNVDGVTLYFYGDTFQTDGRAYGPTYPPFPGGVAPAPKGPISNWRSPVATVDDGGDVRQPIKMVAVKRGGRQLRDYPHDGVIARQKVSTILPTDGVYVNGVIYLWVMVCNGLGNELWCEIWTSKDKGETWDYDGKPRDANAYNKMRRMLTWDRGGDGYVYAITTTGLARDRNAIAFRIPEGSILDESTWRGWHWDGKSWGWRKDLVTEILQPGYELGEVCLRRIQNHWVFSGFDAGAYNGFVKTGYGRWEDINWHTTRDLRPVSGVGRAGADQMPNLYGCYVHPRSTFRTDGQGFTMVVSRWESDGEPYNAYQVNFGGMTPMGALPAAAVTAPTPAPSPGAAERTITLKPGETIEVVAK